MNSTEPEVAVTPQADAAKAGGVPVADELASPSIAAMPEATGSGVRVRDVELDRIVPNPHQPRRHFDEASLKALAASIATTGVIQPVVVRETGAGQYELIAGERRWRAAKLAVLATLPVIVRDVDPVLQAQMALIENIQREDLNAIDRAQAYQTLTRQLGLTHAELAIRLGEDRSSITNFVRLLDLSELVQGMIRDGQLSVGHGKLLAGVADTAEQLRLAQLAINQGLSVRNLERLLASTPATPPSPDRAAPVSAHLPDLERTLSRQLGMKVQVRASSQKGRGKLILHYGSLDQFDDLVERLGVRTEEG